MFANRLFADKRNTLIGYDIIRLSAYEGAVDALHGQRLVVVAVGNLLSLTILGIQLCFHLSKGIILRYRVIDGISA